MGQPPAERKGPRDAQSLVGSRTGRAWRARPDEGSIRLDGRELVGLEPHAIIRLGVARTFQTVRLFLNMTVKENVMAAACGHTRTRPWQSVLRTPAARREEREVGELPLLVERTFELIQRVHDSGVAMLVVEQNANMALAVADRGYVLQTGRIVLADQAGALRAHEDLRRAYLGSS